MRCSSSCHSIAKYAKTARKNCFTVAAGTRITATIASQAKEELVVDELTAIADRGYYSGEEFAKCKADNIQVIAPKPDRGSNAQSGGFTKYHFRYDTQENVYICPQGHKLTPPRRKRSKQQGTRYSNASACANCPSKELCTPKSKYRYIARLEYDDYADEVDAFTRENYDLYGKRKCLC